MRAAIDAPSSRLFVQTEPPRPAQPKKPSIFELKSPNPRGHFHTFSTERNLFPFHIMDTEVSVVGTGERVLDIGVPASSGQKYVKNGPS
jgi:hypothetical protein